MKKLLSAIGVLFLSAVLYGNIIRAQVGIPFPGPGAASSAQTYALVAQICAGSTGGSAITTGAASFTNSTILVLALADWNNGVITTTITSSPSNTWTALTSQDAGTNHPRATLYYAKNPSVSGSMTFTASPSATAYPSICAFGFSGANTSAPLDQQNGAHSTANTTLATGSITPGSNNQLIITMLAGDTNSSATPSVDSGITFAGTSGTDFIASSGSNHWGIAMGYKIQTTAAAINPTWTFNATLNGDGVSIASFKPGP